jgi:hypothetical protein
VQKVEMMSAMFTYKLTGLFLSIAFGGYVILVGAQKPVQTEAKAGVSVRKCKPNPESLYDRHKILKELADLLNHSIPEFSKANPKGFYTDGENGIGFFVVDLTNPSNEYVSLGDCVDFINGDVYHVAPLHEYYSLSQIVILEEGKLKVFRSINCPGRGDRLEDVLNYVSARLSNDKQKNEIINRIRDYRKYDHYFALNHVNSICKEPR